MNEACVTQQKKFFGILFNSMLTASWFMCEFGVHLCRLIKMCFRLYNIFNSSLLS